MGEFKDVVMNGDNTIIIELPKPSLWWAGQNWISVHRPRPAREMEEHPLASAGGHGVTRRLGWVEYELVAVNGWSA
jgi:hypothetical protein